MSFKIEWKNQFDLASRSYICGHCSHPLASNKGFLGHYKNPTTGNPVECYIYTCHHCTGPTFFFDQDRIQIPGALIGDEIKHINDKSVSKLYLEARRCFSVKSYTAAVLCCRKLLMHIAVSKKAPKNKRYIEYVEYLADNHYLPPGSEKWVDHIRKKGNETNHTIVITNKKEATDLLKTVEVLLTIVYEMSARLSVSKTKRNVEPKVPISTEAPGR